MTDLYDVHNARFDAPADEDITDFLKEHFNVTDTPQDTNEARRIIDALTVPFRRDQISQRKIGGRMLDYVEGHEYITRLNEASPAWSFRMTRSDMQPMHVTRYVDRQPVQKELPCLVVHGELTIPGVGTRAGIGVQMIEDNAGEDVMKGALTDCLKNCAKYFGLGLHMYSGDPPADEPVHYAIQSDVGAPGPVGEWAPDKRQPSLGKRGLEEKRTDQQGRDIWKASKGSRDLIREWCQPYGVTNDRDLTEAQAAEIIATYGSQR